MPPTHRSTHHSVVIVGGGTAGITVAARLRRAAPDLDVALIEPLAHHDYQPIWTLVGAGVVDRKHHRRPEADLIPPGVSWIQDAVEQFEPEQHMVVTRTGQRIGYEQLVVAVGIQLDWHRIKGLQGHLGQDGICSNYSYETVESTWRFLRTFQGGNAVFTHPSGPIKCGGAPQKIMYLADDWLRRTGVRERSRVIYAAATAGIFGVPRYARTLEGILQRKGIETHFRHNLIEVRPASRQAVFQNLDTQEEVIIPYDLLHVVPPQSAPDVVKTSPLADAQGWVEVDKHTLQHRRFPSVFSLGDCSSLPCSRTGAAIRKQAPVLVANLLSLRAGRPLTARYNGYSSCPLVTGYGRVVLAEFDYDGNPVETFPFDQSKERRSMWLLKRYVLPVLYWHGMLRGLA
ncbi:MAG: FAD/NAD(P)-binding oxidoreductase [Myxococcales bacterium]|nr:NAD(P)/FAD-dependent oxidoreductase [Myxococcota bacterium]MDW8280971.1 FAD/NAD(P)-binding oxidoreductase [Myxococcales bacterium]